MENKNPNRLQEQEAPLKNDDRAFVQVGKNGEPVFPEPANQPVEQEDQQNDPATPDKR
ncbi:MAG TPA: hypothetical protein VFL47_02785 [Flavisolibacter sp.]|nr:hypothetical protein [Flavisolibacter sp.]